MVLVMLKTIKMHWWVSWWQKRGNHGNVAIVVVVKGITELWIKMGGWDQRDFISIIFSSKPPPTHFYCFPCSATTFSVFTLLPHFYLFYLFIAIFTATTFPFFSLRHHHFYRISIVSRHHIMTSHRQHRSVEKKFKIKKSSEDHTMRVI